MTDEPKAVVPPMPKLSACGHPIQCEAPDESHYCLWCAQIASTRWEAQRADGAEEKSSALAEAFLTTTENQRSTAQARIAELEAAIARDMGGDYLSLQALYVRQIATLAQRSHELLALRTELQACLDDAARYRNCAADAWKWKYSRAWDAQTERTKATLASTAQAADEAERKILESAWERIKAADGCECDEQQWIYNAIFNIKGEHHD